MMAERVFSVALYGLLVFYSLTKDDLVGKKPLAKFLCIKLIVMFTFYQSFVVRFNFLTFIHTMLRALGELVSYDIASSSAHSRVGLSMVCFINTEVISTR